MVKEVHGRGGARMGAAYQSLPTRATKPKTPGFLHVSSPTKPYRIPCSRCETLRRIRIGLPTVTRMPIWLHHRYRIVLPIITSRGVKYTHDINCTVLHSNRGPPGLCGISQASDQKKVVVGDGGAKHRSVDPPTTWHSVADPHAASTIDQGGPPGLDPTTRSFWAYDVYSHTKAFYFGKEFLRMAGIVQMLHALHEPNDN